MRKSIVIAAGGTGGHLFPAQSLADDLQGRMPDCRLIFMAKGLLSNPRFERRYPAFDVSSSGISLKAFLTIPKGIIESLAILKREKPAAVIGFGSFHTIPVLCAARMLNIPIILHEANRIPGKVNRLFAPFAAVNCVYFPDTKLRGKVVKTDLPLRAHFANSFRPSKSLAQNRYGLDLNKKTLLVFGGSLGAKRLNLLAAQSIVRLGNELQVVHFTGNQEQVDEISSFYEQKGVYAYVKEFEHEMPYAWTAADLVICRAGACSIAESITYTVPALFIPFPRAADNHQDKNAEFVVHVINGAYKLAEKGLEPEFLSLELKKILDDRSLQQMRGNLKEWQGSMQERRFSDLIVDFLSNRA